jgi:PhzF family phenazine biosynthesis protein
MKIPCFKVDAFTGEIFHGNPAAVCPLEKWLPTATLQNIATENNLSETAFVVPRGNEFELRWFTPTMEVDLCGHATLASAFVLFTEQRFFGDEIRFHSLSGILSVTREDEILTLDFPSRPPQTCDAPEALVRGLGRMPVEVFKARDFVAVFESADDVKNLRPDFAVLKTLDCLGIIATAKGDDCDFVSRFFAPAAGIDEDPVTGSAHCTLIPFWAGKLKKNKMFARQISRRGGELFCELASDRVRIGGKARLFMRGEIFI